MALYDETAEPKTERGRWKYLPVGHGNPECDSDEATIILDNVYGFDADRISNNFELAQWALHMAAKDWVDDADIGCLIRLVFDLRELGLLPSNPKDYNLDMYRPYKEELA